MYLVLIAVTRLYTLLCQSVGRSVQIPNCERFLHCCPFPTVRHLYQVSGLVFLYETSYFELSLDSLKCFSALRLKFCSLFFRHAKFTKNICKYIMYCFVCAEGGLYAPAYPSATILQSCVTCCLIVDFSCHTYLQMTMFSAPSSRTFPIIKTHFFTWRRGG